jgi:hypothetical protein
METLTREIERRRWEQERSDLLRRMGFTTESYAEEQAAIVRDRVRAIVWPMQYQMLRLIESHVLHSIHRKAVAAYGRAMPDA